MGGRAKARPHALWLALNGEQAMACTALRGVSFLIDRVSTSSSIAGALGIECSREKLTSMVGTVDNRLPHLRRSNRLFRNGSPQ
jgi:hypothetical protein